MLSSVVCNGEKVESVQVHVRELRAGDELPAMTRAPDSERSGSTTCYVENDDELRRIYQPDLRP